MPGTPGRSDRATIVSIAAGASQLPLLHAARRLGFGIVAVDRDPDAAGFALADVAVRCSTHDAAAVERALAPVAQERELAAVVTKSSGVPVAVAARVARSLGLSGLDPEVAALAVTKPGTMELAARAGVPTPAHAAVRTLEELAAHALGPPLVLKPSLTAVGKAGISLVRDASSLAARFAEARAASADDVVEVEEYVAGSDVTVVALFDDEGFQSLGLIDEDTGFAADDRAWGRGFAMPSRLCGTELDGRLVGHAARLVEANAFGTGTGFFTFRVGEERIALLEMHLDLAGDLVAERLLPAATGIDFLEAALLHLSACAPPPPRPAASPVAIRFLFAGDLAHDRDAKLAALRARFPGDAVDLGIPATGEGARRRLGCVLLRAETPEALQECSRDLDRLLGREKGL